MLAVDSTGIGNESSRYDDHGSKGLRQVEDETIGREEVEVLEEFPTWIQNS